MTEMRSPRSRQYIFLSDPVRPVDGVEDADGVDDARPSVLYALCAYGSIGSVRGLL